MSEQLQCISCGAVLGHEIVLCPDCGTPVPGRQPPKVAVEQFTPDCANCHALCCVALAFNWPGYDKPAGTPCKHLTEDFTCGRWETLESDGYFGCRGFDCHGAGQATAATMERACGGNWRDAPGARGYELATFQKVYGTLFELATGKPPPVARK